MERLFDSIQDQPEDVPTVLKGNLPAWLTGYLFRLGPGKWDLDDDFSLKHWFDGCAILYRFAIADGKVTYRSRFLDSDAYAKICTVKRPVFTEFGTKSYPDPCKNIFSRFMSSLVPRDLTDNVMGNVFTLSDELYCVTETCNLWKVDPESLQTTDKVDLNKIVSVNLASAHPCTDDDGMTYNLGASFVTGLKYHIIKMPPVDSKLKASPNGPKAFEKTSVLCSIPSSWSTCFGYYHSFGLSLNYIVFLEQPMLVNTLKLATSRVKGYSLRECFEWSPKEKSRFVVIDKNSGQVIKIKYTTEPFFSFHVVHTYECENNIIIDLIAYETGSIVDKFFMKRMKAGEFDDVDPPHLRRYVLPVGESFPEGENLVTLPNHTATAIMQQNGTMALTPQLIGQPGFELPTVNSKYNGKPYRYIYGCGLFEKGPFRNSICKLDLHTEEVKVWRGSEHVFPGEAKFVPTPGATDEDDGVLLTAAVDTRPTHPDFFLVLDACNLEELARAEVKPDTRISPAIHSHFMKLL